MKMDEMTHEPSRNGNMMKCICDIDCTKVQSGNVVKYRRYLGKINVARSGEVFWKRGRGSIIFQKSRKRSVYYIYIYIFLHLYSKQSPQIPN